MASKPHVIPHTKYFFATKTHNFFCNPMPVPARPSTSHVYFNRFHFHATQPTGRSKTISNLQKSLDYTAALPHFEANATAQLAKSLTGDSVHRTAQQGPSSLDHRYLELEILDMISLDTLGDTIDKIEKPRGRERHS
jgi:hypothetical protein